MNYKLNSDKIREVLADKNTNISGIEKHLIQEGLKQITLGTGPIHVEVPGGGSISTITPSLERYLLDAGIVEKETKLAKGTIFDGVLDAINSNRQPDALVSGAPSKIEFESWDYKGLLNNAQFFGTQRDWNQTLLSTIVRKDMKHLKKTNEHFNCLIVSSNVGLIFDSLEYFYEDDWAAGNKHDKKNKIEYLGTLKRFKVFVDLEIGEDTIIFAHVEDLTENSYWPKANKIEQTPENTLYVANAIL